VDGSRVAELRKAAGKTQAELAREANVSLMHLSAIERGAVTDIKVDTASKLAGALGITIDQLLGKPAGKAVGQ
jgi:transcriptional regulator with XRE-family HTH domain